MVLLKELVEEAKLKNRKKKIEPTIKGKKGEKRKRNHYKKNKTKTGFYNLYIIKCEKCSQGFFWQYKFEEINISRVDFFELKKIVLNNNWEWGIEERNTAFKTSKIVGLPLYDLIN